MLYVVGIIYRFVLQSKSRGSFQHSVLLQAFEILQTTKNPHVDNSQSTKLSYCSGLLLTIPGAVVTRAVGCLLFFPSVFFVRSEDSVLGPLTVLVRTVKHLVYQ